MRESLSKSFRKRKLDQNGKRHFHTVEAMMKVEVGLWIGLQGRTMKFPLFRFMCWFPGRVSQDCIKHTGVFYVRWQM